jgi:hypothetical protein
MRPWPLALAYGQVDSLGERLSVSDTLDANDHAGVSAGAIKIDLNGGGFATPAHERAVTLLSIIAGDHVWRESGSAHPPSEVSPKIGFDNLRPSNGFAVDG